MLIKANKHPDINICAYEYSDYVKLKQKKIKLLLDTGAKLEDSVIPLNRKLGLSKKVKYTDEKCVLINKISLKSLASVQHKTNKIDNSQSMSCFIY